VQRDPTITALAACGLSCLKAANGHHRRWAVKRCTDALVAAIGNRLADMAADAALRGRRDPGRAHAE